MAGSVNKVIILGYLGKDPEYRAFNNGGGVTNLSVSTSETWKDKVNGERKERTEWHRVTILNDTLGEIVGKYAKKGDRIYVEGTLQTRKWTGNDGIEKFSTEVVVKGFQGVVNLLGRQEKRGQATSQANYDDEPRQSTRPSGDRRSDNPDDLNDEIPF